MTVSYRGSKAAAEQLDVCFDEFPYPKHASFLLKYHILSDK